mgnify:CR=1 FL=1
MTMNSVQNWLGWVRQWNRRRATVRTLRALPDWQLRDIGLTRDQIVTVVDSMLGANTSKHPAAIRPQIRRQALPNSGGKALTT